MRMIKVKHGWLCIIKRKNLTFFAPTWEEAIAIAWQESHL